MKSIELSAQRLGRIILPALILIGGTLPISATATSVQQSGTDLVFRGDSGGPLPAATINIVSTDGTIKADAIADPNGLVCVIPENVASTTPRRPDCIYLPDGDYRLFVNNDAPVRFSVAQGALSLPDVTEKVGEEPSSDRGKLYAGAAVVIGLGVAAGGGGGGGGGGNNQPPDPESIVSVDVSPTMLEGSFEFGVSPCPTSIGTINVVNIGDTEARVSATAPDGISVSGVGQLIAPGATGTLEVLYNCLVIAAIAGNIQVTLSADGQTDTDTVEIVVDFI
ncbi:MAG: hypothetical protein DHS20C01_01020 [marine bacterium B5-7]|nr:MAG: hypothetical protein DHS20C01_01020 [marine bacterium B5-7]